MYELNCEHRKRFFHSASQGTTVETEILSTPGQWTIGWFPINSNFLAYTETMLKTVAA